MADVARLRVIFEGDTSDLDRAYARAKTMKRDFTRDMGRSGDEVKIKGDASDLEDAYASARSGHTDLIRKLNRAGAVTLKGDSSDLQRSFTSAGRASEGFQKSMADSQGSITRFAKETVKVRTDTDRTGDAFARLGNTSSDASGGLHELASAARSVRTVFVATTVIPGVIAAIGGIPAVATAAAGATTQLALGLGQGLAGGAAIGIPAIYGAVGALKAYTAALSSTVSASREAYFTLNENAEEQLQQQRATILNTKANQQFQQQINTTILSLSRFQAALGTRVFPVFTSELRAWTNLMPRFHDRMLDTAQVIVQSAAGFSRWVRTAQDGQLVGDMVSFVNNSARHAAIALDLLGRAGLRTFQLIIPYALDLQEAMVRMAGSIDMWTRKDQNMMRVNDILAGMYGRFNQLVRIVRNFGSGLIGVFTALWNQGGPQRLMDGLEGMSVSFDKLMQKGNGARQSIINFMNRSNPALNQMWKLTKEVVIQFGLLANNVVKAGQSGGKMGTLAEVIAGIRKSIAPLRRMFQETFIALGPALAKLLPELAKFMSVFLGSTGPLVVFVKSLTLLLRIFNSMPGPVKSLVANLVALKAILGGLGVGSLVSGFIRAKIAATALTIASGKQITTLGLLRQSFFKTGAAAQASTAGTTASSTAAAAAGGRWAAFRGVLARVGGVLLTVGRFLLGPWGIAIAGAVTAGVLLYKNWDRIAKAAQPITKVLGVIARAVGALARILGGAIMTGLRAFAQGFMQAIFPGRKMSEVSKSLAASLSALGQRVLPPVSRAFSQLAMFMERHQGAFRMVGRIVGTVLVSGFRVWGFVLRTTWRVVAGTVRVLLNLGDIMRRVGKAAFNFGQTVAKATQGMARRVMSIIRGFGSAFLKAWQTSIWGRAAKFLVERARGMVRTLSNFRADAVRWVRSLVPQVGKRWNNFWQAGATFLSKRKDGERQTLGNFLNSAVNWVQQFPGRVGGPWKKFWQGTADFVVKIKDGIMGTMGNLVDGVIGLWNKLIGFINNVLDAVGLDPIGVGSGGGGGGGGSSGPTAGTVNASGGGLNRPGAKTGGLITKRQVVELGEDGPEYVINPRRHNNVGVLRSAAADMGYNLMPRTHRGGRVDEDLNRPDRYGIRRPKTGGRGEGLGATTYDLVDSVREKANAIASATGTKWNTYVGHGRLGGSTQQYTADFWGPGGRGDPLTASQGYKTASLALEKYNSNPGILYMIRQGEYWRGGGWSGNTFGDPHYDHTHISWDSPGGASASGGLSLWDTIGNAMWERLVGPVYSMFERWQQPDKFVFRRAGGAAGVTALDGIKNWIIGQVGSGGGSSALGGDPAKNRALGEELFKSSGISGSFGSLDSLWMRESGWDRFARNSGSGAYGIPQALPESKLPAAGQRSGGSNAGPQISWGLDYIRGRYGSTDKAWAHSQSTGWYAKGGVIPGAMGRQVLIQAHAGERVLPADMVKSFDRLAHSVQNWARDHRTGGRGGVRVGPQGIFMPGLSVTRSGVQVNTQQLNRGAFAQEDTARTLKRVEKRLGDLDKRIGREVREGINKNVERGLNTNRSMDKSEARRQARRLAGGPRISRAL